MKPVWKGTKHLIVWRLFACYTSIRGGWHEQANITLSLPKETLRRVRLLATQRGMSISCLVTVELERLIAEEDVYLQAQLRHLSLLEKGIDLGTQGRIQMTRDGLHKRTHDG